MKKYCSFISLFLVLGISIVFLPNLVSSQVDLFKIMTENIPAYSFTNPISQTSLSQNGETLLFFTHGKKTGKTYIYTAFKNGYGIKEIFSPGKFQIGQESIYFDNVELTPIVNGKGNKIVLGIRPIRNIEKKTDYILVYDIQKQSTTIFPLRILVSGATYVRLPKQNSSDIIYSMDFEGTKLVIQVEYGFQSIHCSKFDTGLVLMNIDGSNQTNLLGPEEFVASACSFYWKKFPKSPHHAVLNHSGDKVIFYGQVYETLNPYDKNGDLFIMNTNGSNLKQLTQSKRFDIKPESLGSFKSNFYGSEIFFKQSLGDTVYLSSVNASDATIKKHFLFSKETNFIVSGDSHKVFFLDLSLNNSLVFFDITKGNRTLVIDRTWSGTKNNYGALLKITNESLASPNLSNFDGSTLFVPINQEWCYQLIMDNKLISPQMINLEFQAGSITAKSGSRLISMSSPPYVTQGRMMIPAKLFAEIFGIKFIWNPKDQSLQLLENGNNLTVYPNKKYLYDNGKKIVTPIFPEIKSNQVYLPVVWAHDYFYLKLTWNSKSQIILIERIQH